MMVRRTLRTLGPALLLLFCVQGGLGQQDVIERAIIPCKFSSGDVANGRDDGRFVKWSKIEFAFRGPTSQGRGEPNPFAVKLDVDFCAPGGRHCRVPGFLPEGGEVEVQLPAGRDFVVTWWNPAQGRAGNFTHESRVRGDRQKLVAPADGDWAARIVLVQQPQTQHQP